MYDPSIAWWSSHELGHRLVAAPIEIGLAYYGLEEGSPTAEAFGPGHEDYAYCCEHAAMRLSARLLRTIGANDAAGDERNHLRGSSPIAAAWLEIPGNRVKVNALIDRRCRILPYTRAALEKRLRGGHS